MEFRHCYFQVFHNVCYNVLESRMVLFCMLRLCISFHSSLDIYLVWKYQICSLKVLSYGCCWDFLRRMCLLFFHSLFNTEFLYLLTFWEKLQNFSCKASIIWQAIWPSWLSSLWKELQNFNVVGLVMKTEHFKDERESAYTGDQKTEYMQGISGNWKMRNSLQNLLLRHCLHDWRLCNPS